VSVHHILEHGYVLVGERSGATLEVGLQYISIQTADEQDIQVRREIRERGVLRDLICDTLPALGVQEDSHLQDPLGKLFGLSEGRERGNRGLYLSRCWSNQWGLNLHGTHHLG
jgi:hypothetical protein